MPITLPEHANEQSTYVVDFNFTDEDEAPTIPNTLVWSLLNGEGAVINGRSTVSITPAASITIVCSGNDLKSSEGSTRVVLIEATYDSDLGMDLPLRDTVTFQIANLIGVT
jgi:hypothetical protein